MIALDVTLKRVCKKYYLVENYDKAVADKENKWDLHHRREIDENKSKKELIEEGRYYDVEPEELIFITNEEHRKLHLEMNRRVASEFWKGKAKSEEQKKKISEGNKKYYAEHPESKLNRWKFGSDNHMFGRTGEKHPMFGKHHSEEARAKMSAAAKGVSKGKRWWNNGKICKFSKERPGEDFILGRLKFKHSPVGQQALL